MKYIIANWKMNMDRKSILDWFSVFNTKDIEKFEDKTIILAPSFPYLNEVKSLIKHKNVFISSQDVSVYEKGAHTGFIGTFQLNDFCKYCIVGHSERTETPEEVLKKRDRCLEDEITPIVCFAHPDQAKDMEKTGAYIVWEDPQNISTNGVSKAQNVTEINEIIKNIRTIISAQTTLIYGGSVNRDNIKELSQISGLEGVLIGSASLDPDHFFYIIENA